MALSRRYSPSWPPGESAYVGVDLSPLLPPGVALTSGALAIVTNQNPVADASTDWVQYPVQTRGRQAWCWISGGNEGRDYQLRFTVTDSVGQTWQRTALLLCAQTA